MVNSGFRFVGEARAVTIRRFRKTRFFLSLKVQLARRAHSARNWGVAQSVLYFKNPHQYWEYDDGF